MILSFAEKCVTQAQLPEGRLIALGTPESVANVANKVLEPDAIDVLIVCSAAPEGIGDHSLYVGVPKAESVFTD